MMKTNFSEIPYGRVIAASLIAGASFAFATPEMEPQNAEETADFIQMDVQSDARMDGTRVQVEVVDGIAILTGHVATIDQAERAVERAKASVNVRAVISTLEIRVFQISDSLVESEVLAALEKNEALDAGGVTVKVREGRVVLGGTVGTWDEQEIARETASRVKGVKSIENKTEITFEGIRSDGQIEVQLAQLISDDPLYEGLSLTASVKEGVVRLNGEVGSKGEYDRLVRRSSVTGIFEVNADRLSINSDLKMEAVGDKHFTPEQTLAALGDALRMDQRFDAEALSYRFEEGILTLDGEVEKPEQRLAAESTSRGVPGVMAVDNRIRVTGNLILSSAPLVEPR